MTRSGRQQLVNIKINGEDRKVLAHFGRNGIFYTLDRTNGSFIQGTPYVDKLTWTKGLDPKTGLPVEYDPSKSLQVYATGAPRRGADAINTCPQIQGGSTTGRRRSIRPRHRLWRRHRGLLPT